VKDRELTRRLDALARTLPRLLHATTRLRRSIAADAQLLVGLEGGALDALVRPLRLWRQQLEGRR
jgi:hypothetical protein